MFSTKAVRNPDNSISVTVMQGTRLVCVNTYPASWTFEQARQDTCADLADLYR